MNLGRWFKKISSAAEVAEPAMIKRPGAWLKKKLSSFHPKQKLQGVEQVSRFPQRGKNLSDEEIAKILDEAIQGKTEKGEGEVS